jgi:hypothetical protein
MYMTIKRRKSNKKMKGGCGCSGQSTPSFFSGGQSSMMKGGNALGPASFTPSDSASNYTYSIFNVNDDPLNPNQITDARQLPNPPISGGRRRRTRKSKTSKRKSKKNNRRSYRRSYRKYKGGSDQFIKNYDNNLLSKSNTVMGAYTGANIVSANTTDISKPFSTPPFL